MTLFEAIRKIANNPNVDEATLERIATTVIDTFGDEPTIDQIASVVEQEGTDMTNSKAITFEVNGIVYNSNDKGNRFYETPVGGKKTRISEQKFNEMLDAYNLASDNAWEKEADAEKKAREDKVKADAKQAEEAVAKKTKKKSKKNVAFELDGTTLTEKQVDFIKHVPDTSFYENGLDSAMWIDVLVDEIGGQFANKPMPVGAMISTLREKGVIFVDADRINGKKCKFFRFTELGKRIAAELGLK